MLESELKKLTTAVEANTAALTRGSAPVAAVPNADPEVVTPVDVLAAGQAAPLPPAPADQAADAVPAVTLKDITVGIVALCKSNGREAAAMLLAEYGVQKVPELKKYADKYDEILDKINALIEAK